jgi:hypothetical protein
VIDQLNAADSLSAALREMSYDSFDDMRTTHSEFCWQWHIGCAARLAADRLDMLEASVKILRQEKRTRKKAARVRRHIKSFEQGYAAGRASAQEGVVDGPS